MIRIISTLPGLGIAICGLEMHKKTMNHVSITEMQKSNYNLELDRIIKYCTDKLEYHKGLSDESLFPIEATAEDLAIVLTGVEAYRHLSISQVYTKEQWTAIAKETTAVIDSIRGQFPSMGMSFVAEKTATILPFKK